MAKLAHFGILLSWAVLAGCSNTVTQDEAPLPFKAALIPVTVKVWSPPVEDATELDIKLALGAEDMTARLMEALEKRCFVDIVTLQARSNPTSVSQANREWEREAKAVGADILLQCELQFTPSIHTRGGDFFWTNFAVHQLGGPFCWFVDDRSYLSPASLEISIHDMQTIDSRRGNLLGKAAEILSVDTEFEGADLSFADRNENFGNYFLSILVPVGLMAHENEKIRARLEEEVVNALAESIAQAIREDWRDLVWADRLVPFTILPDGLTVRRLGEGGLFVTGEALLKSKAGTGEELDGYRLTAGNKTMDFTFDASPIPAPNHGADILSYPIQAQIEAAPRVESVQITLWDTNDFPRSFTFPVTEDGPEKDVTP